MNRLIRQLVTHHIIACCSPHAHLTMVDAAYYMWKTLKYIEKILMTKILSSTLDIHTHFIYASICNDVSRLLQQLQRYGNSHLIWKRNLNYEIFVWISNGIDLSLWSEEGLQYVLKWDWFSTIMPFYSRAVTYASHWTFDWMYIDDNIRVLSLCMVIWDM